ncbi:hypothetical protein GLOTRDRAFT_93548 [Gloeophyllum trabeum ATCC 11539]|uniref:F-box domain-containing protein n=1 Tax=Gloeophyllum trabeum (strain ATCC 11539 / FP-39264 / Madison 617) TaxID=670483 RepID=S7RNJ9_GLOTA|nr:uncharacterized protein GLOTRDRAFT_93548 [Gloeophyllum trabeum ATCC 11539]EPQ56060.1 hypothetical protein GLOTRDRAFT_93548 [Gloeophyllum trabeum ATCC 11539]
MMDPLRLGLLGLAVELIIHILKELDFKDIVSLRRVCNDLKCTVDESIALQYEIELAVAGMEDNPGSRLNTAERLSRLRRYTLSWQDMNFKTTETLPAMSWTLSVLRGGILGRVVDDSQLVFNRLPAHARGIDAREWRLPNAGFDVKAMADPLSPWLSPTCVVHVRTLATGDPHPLATKSTVSLPDVDYYNMRREALVDIEGPQIHFGVQFWQELRDLGEFIVLNWKTCVTLLNTCSSRSDTSRWPSCMVLAGTWKCTISGKRKVAPSFWNEENYHCAFAYSFGDRDPEWNDTCLETYLCRPWRGQDGHDSDVPFYSAPHSQVLALYVKDHRWPRWPMCAGPLLHLVPVSSLLSLIPQARGAVGTTWLWDHWGGSSLLIEGVPAIDTLRSTYGNKLVYNLDQEEDGEGTEGPRTVAVIEFNPPSARRALGDVTDTSSGPRMHRQYVGRFPNLPPPSSFYDRVVMIYEDGLVFQDVRILFAGFWFFIIAIISLYMSRTAGYVPLGLIVRLNVLDGKAILAATRDGTPGRSTGGQRRIAHCRPLLAHLLGDGRAAGLGITIIFWIHTRL